MNTQAPPTTEPLDSYRDHHSGATMLVCGCGVSLRGFTPPTGVLTIGVNDVGRAFDPDYLVVLNAPSQFAADRFRHVAASRARAVFSHLDLGLRDVPLVRFRLGQRGGVDAPRRGELHYARNSPYTAVHLAALMGAQRIGLIGVDFTDDHFFADTGCHQLTRTLPRIDSEYAALAKALNRRGIDLVNLSPVSRITSLPRRDAEDFCRPGPPVSKSSHSARAKTRQLTLAIPRQRSGPIGDLMDALAASAAKLGHSVRRGPPNGMPPDTIAVAWNGRSLKWPGRAIFCEHGWLPRSAYQISPKGINADSHIAPFSWDGTALTVAEHSSITRHLARLRKEARTASATVGGAPHGPFYLVPLQMEYDTNLTRHAPPHLRRMQGLIDAIARADPPLPVVFKQHPADLKRGRAQARLKLRRKQDVFWPHDRGDIHGLLASGRCAGIVSVNSNVVHDGLIHDVPAVVLGRNVWPSEGPTPFLTALPGDWTTLDLSAKDPDWQGCRLAYAHHLVRHQWTLADARAPEKVAALLNALPAGTAPLPRSVAEPRRSPSAAPPRARSGRDSSPRVNIYSRNKGWRFEEIKAELLARARTRGLNATVSDTPRADAGAWIAIRTTEASSSPDLARTLVQVHDLREKSAYGPGGERAILAQAGRVQLLHDSQQSLLAGHPQVDRSRILPCLMPGSSAVPSRSGQRPGRGVGWFGRPELHEGRERHRPDLFVAALCACGPRARVVLGGDKLSPYAETLRNAGLEVTTLPVASVPLSRWPEHIAGLDCLVLTGDFDPAPQPLFDAIALGVPVIAPPVGWAAELLKHGTLGHLATTVEEINHALDRVESGRSPAQAPRDHAGAVSMNEARSAWLDQSLDAAIALAREGASRQNGP